MTKNHKKLTALIIAVVASTFSVTTNAATTTTTSNVKNITANTFIGDAGRKVDSFEIEVDNIGSLKNITADDFDITNNSDNNVDDLKDDDIVLNKKGNVLKIDVADFYYNGLTKYDTGKPVTANFKVTCNKYPELSFTKDNVTEVKTETVDEFTAGTFTASNGLTLPYRLYMPKTNKAVPLMVWLHGGGEVGTDNKINITANRGATTWIEGGYETAVLSFQFPTNYAFGISEKPDQLKLMQEYFDLHNEMIQKLIKEGKIDTNRIYLSGASSGGGGAIRFAMQYPNLFAGVVAICAKDTLIPMTQKYNMSGGYVTYPLESYGKDYTDVINLLNIKGLTDVPIWFLQANHDPICTSYTTKFAYNALNELGAKNNKLTLYSDEEMGKLFKHASWEKALNDPAVVKWIYSQSKAPVDTKN